MKTYTVSFGHRKYGVYSVERAAADIESIIKQAAELHQLNGHGWGCSVWYGVTIIARVMHEGGQLVALGSKTELYP